MAEAPVDPTGLAHLARPGLGGCSAGSAGVALSLLRDRACALVIARKGQADQLAGAVGQAYGVTLPQAPRCVASHAIAFAGTAPGQWLAFRTGSDDGAAFEAELRGALAAHASISDQTDARVGVRVSGPRMRDMLAKLLPIDLDERVFVAGCVASSLLGHVSVTVIRPVQSHSVEIFVSRSYAESFWRAIVAAGTEFGFEVS